MIHSLRRQHRWWLTIATPILTILVVSALARRPPPPLIDMIPAGVAPTGFLGEKILLMQGDALWSAGRIQTSIYRFENDDLGLQLAPSELLMHPVG